MFEWFTKSEEISLLKIKCAVLERKVELCEGVCNYQKLLLANQPKIPFQESDKKTLLKLVHPDKHGGSKQAEEMFIKINQSWK